LWRQTGGTEIPLRKEAPIRKVEYEYERLARNRKGGDLRAGRRR